MEYTIQQMKDLSRDERLNLENTAQNYAAALALEANPYELHINYDKREECLAKSKLRYRIPSLPQSKLNELREEQRELEYGTEEFKAIENVLSLCELRFSDWRHENKVKENRKSFKRSEFFVKDEEGVLTNKEGVFNLPHGALRIEKEVGYWEVYRNDEQLCYPDALCDLVGIYEDRLQSKKELARVKLTDRYEKIGSFNFEVSLNLGLYDAEVSAIAQRLEDDGICQEEYTYIKIEDAWGNPFKIVKASETSEGLIDPTTFEEAKTYRDLAFTESELWAKNTKLQNQITEAYQQARDCESRAEQLEAELKANQVKIDAHNISKEEFVTEQNEKA